MIRVKITVVLLLALPACDYFFSPDPGYPFPEDPMELPLATGSFEREWREGLRLLACVDREGEIRIRGDVMKDDRTLTQRMLVFAERKRDLEHPLELSGVMLGIYADRRAPWSSVARLIRLCADAEVRIWMVDLAVRSTEHDFITYLRLAIDPPGLGGVPQRLIPRGKGLARPPVRLDASADADVGSVLAPVCRARAAGKAFVVVLDGAK